MYKLESIVKRETNFKISKHLINAFIQDIQHLQIKILWRVLSQIWNLYIVITLLNKSTFCTYIHVYTYVYIHIYMHTQTHIYIHTHTVQSLSHVRLFLTQWIAARQASLSITNSWSLLKLMSIKHWYHPAMSSSVVPFSSCPQSLPASGMLPVRWAKYWNFTFNISPSNEHSGLISFRMDWLVGFLAVQGTLKSLLQHHSSKASIFRRSGFFHSPTLTSIHPLEKPYPWLAGPLLANLMTVRFNMLSRLVITFLPKSEHLLISWLQSHLQWFWSPEK